MLVLFTDTDTDVTPAIAKKYGYHLISMPYTINGKDIYPYEDFEKFDPHAFYDSLRSGVLPSTSALSPAKYYTYFEPVFQAGNDILYVHFSTAMSSSFSFMQLALKELKEKYPERNFYSVDTKAITIGSLNIAEEIGELAAQGKSVAEILAWADTEVDHFATYFYAEDLRFFRRSGRVGGISATMGNILGVRPIIYIGSDGKMQNIGKERGRTHALTRLLDYVAELGDHIEDHRVIVGHSDSPEIAHDFADMLRARFGSGLNIEFSDVNPTAGSHCGPSGVGVCFHSIHR